MKTDTNLVTESLNEHFHENVTIFIQGHYADNFPFFLNHLLLSLPDELYKCQFVVNYDNPDRIDEKWELDQPSQVEVENVFRNNFPNLSVRFSYDWGGLLVGFHKALLNCSTPYMILLEHDWVF